MAITKGEFILVGKKIGHIEGRAGGRVNDLRTNAIWGMEPPASEKNRERFLDAGWVSNAIPGVTNPRWQAHRHSVIVIGFDLGAVQRSGRTRSVSPIQRHRCRVRTFIQFRLECLHPFSFLQAQTAELGEINGHAGKRRYCDWRS